MKLGLRPRSIVAIVGAVGLACLFLTVGIAWACGGGGEEPCGFEAPSATTNPADFITAHAADLHGTVNPHGCETSYVFEYGTTTSYGGLAGGGSAGSGTTAAPQTGTVAGLLAGTTYHYRISATNKNGTTKGGDQVFATPTETTKPVVTTEAASEITKSTATLNGIVNPGGLSATYVFEYGPTISYGKSSETGGLGAGTSGVKVSKGITGLEPSTTYHFRLSATNSNGTTAGGDKTFTTSATGNWTVDTTPNPTGATSSRLSFASCTAANACTNVGWFVNGSGVKVPLAERWNGTAWSAQTPPSGTGASAGELLGVSCSSATACSASGFYEASGVRSGLVEGWNGTSWTLQTAATPTGATSTELSAISCTSSTACTAVGHYATSSSSVTLAERWNGSTWTVQTTPNPSGATESTLLGVSCATSTACIATGYYYNSSGVRQTLAESWNGSTWTVQSTPNRTGASLNILLGVSCSATNACTAVGGDFPTGGGPQETLVERWNGTEWAIQTSANPAGSEASVLHGVSCVSAAICTAVGDYISGGVNVTLAERWNGTAWSLLTTPNPSGATLSALWSVSCISGSECEAPGYYKNSSGTEFALTERGS
jgi:hypothetical protein